MPGGVEGGSTFETSVARSRRLPTRFSGSVRRSGTGGCRPPAQQAKLEDLTDALARLARKGLTAAAVIANFHRQRVIPLVERALPIYQLTPGSKVEGSRTSSKLLSHTNAARRAKYAVADFPQDPADLWRIKMRPEPGYISLVSFGFELVVRRVAPFPDPVSCVLRRG